VSSLAWGLLAIAALLAERGSRWARRDRVRSRLVVAVAAAPAARAGWRAWLGPIAGAVAGFALGQVVGAVLGFAAGVAARRIGERKRAAAVRGLRDEQIGDMAAGVASAMRAGLSLPQALAAARDEAEPPLRDELVVLVDDLQVGVDVDAALEAWIGRVGTDDARLLASALTLHRRTGGDLPKVLDQVVATIRERVAIAREVRGLTAQARLSGLILGLLPVAFFGFLWVTSRADMQAALSTPAGVMAVVIGASMEAGAFLWIRKLLEVG
jgi:Flp pilus assembly protein TadB